MFCIGVGVIANAVLLWITHLLLALVFVVAPFTEEPWLEEQYGDVYRELSEAGSTVPVRIHSADSTPPRRFMALGALGWPNVSSMAWHWPMATRSMGRCVGRTGHRCGRAHPPPHGLALCHDDCGIEDLDGGGEMAGAVLK